MLHLFVMITENFVFSAVIFSVLFSTSLVFATKKTVQTPYGGIEGDVIYYDRIPVEVFLGIPFAKPPVGDLRFRRPSAIEPWNTTIKCNVFKSGCIQYSPNPFPYKDYQDLSEDCLYLNIWAPQPIKRPPTKTIMFWIHGGGFRISSSRVDFYNGLPLAALGDVIVVTSNYRLGPQGFLYSGTEDAPGNMGLMDMVEALKWVRGNIHAFGGNKDSITLFGQSAGAIAIGMFCTSPITRGLFKRAIMQSGAPTNLDGEDNDRSFRLSQQLAEAEGCGDESDFVDVECLRTVDPLQLSKTLSKLTANDRRSFYPRYGDELLPKNPRRAIMDGDFQNVDLFIGSNDGDGSPLLTRSMKDEFGFFGEKDPQINITFAEAIIRQNFQDYPNPDAVVRQYLGNVRNNDFRLIRQQVFTALGDYSRVCPCNYFAESFAKKPKHNVYYYFYIHRPTYNSPYAPWMLAVHFDETPFVFGYPLRYPSNYTVKEKFLSRRMILIWSAFAKTGNPTIWPIPGLWPMYSKEDPKYKDLDVDGFNTEFGPDRSNCDFFRSYFGF